MKNIFLYIDAVCVSSLLIGLSITLLCYIKEVISYPTRKLREEILGRLPSYMMDAERLYGKGTGEVKLSYVYGRFCKDYPWAKKWVSIYFMNELVCHKISDINRLANNKSSEVL